MNKLARFVISSVLLSLLHLTASAAVLFQQPPAAELYGIQADASTGALVQMFNVAPNASLENIRWWGFHGLNSTGPAADAFELYINGEQVNGALTTSETDGLTEYSLALSAPRLNATSLTLWNNSFDVEWFWQSTAVGDDANAAFVLEGMVAAAQVPETNMLALFMLALVACAWSRRRPAVAAVG